MNKFERVVRDLAGDQGKTIQLTLAGQDVELDKTILEAINDPLTHLVRNSVDHGVELPEQRKEKGKDTKGCIRIEACHEAGQVNILISDDGKGIDPDKTAAAALAKGLVTQQQLDQMTDKHKMELVLLPGFSTAEKITDLSGRGVGMDVVTTNIENLGGVVELDSTPGKGTDVMIKLPLTLAIIPSQIVMAGDERYAVPQVNLSELLRIPAAEVKNRIERVGNADVVRLRGELLPLLDLAGILGIEKSYTDTETGEKKPDNRKSIADRRSRRHRVPENGTGGQTAAPRAHDTNERKGEDRRKRPESAVNVAVVSAGAIKYGLIVDELQDSEEIVVKPVGRYLKKYQAFAGATIMGDGRVALILDIANLAGMARLSAVFDAAQAVTPAGGEAVASGKDSISLLTFKNGEKEHFAAPLNLVERIERIRASDIEIIGNNKVIQYRGGTLMLFEMAGVADFDSIPEAQFHEVVVFRVKEREIGLIVSGPVDAIEVPLNVETSAFKQRAVSGSMTINGKTTLLVDVLEMVKMV